MYSETLNYEANGVAMTGRLYFDPAITAPRPAVLVLPEAYGLGRHAMERAERLAELGYVTLACDLHGGARQLEGMDEIMAVIGPLRENQAAVRALGEGALRAMVARREVDPQRVAAIGFCFGGTMAFELARGGYDIRAAIGFHSGLTATGPGDARAIRAKVLACIGADDPSIPPEQRAAFEEEMRSGGVDWQLHVYGGVVHSFTNRDADDFGRPDFARYDRSADMRSWAALRHLLEEVFDAA